MAPSLGETLQLQDSNGKLTNNQNFWALLQYVVNIFGSFFEKWNIICLQYVYQYVFQVENCVYKRIYL